MKIIYIGFKDLLITLRDKKALALLILMPIALIFVLGLGLNNAFNSSTEIEKFDVAISDYDNGQYAKEFKDFLKSKEIKKIISLKEMKESTAKEKVKSGKLPVLLVIPKGYSESIEKGQKANIEIFKDAGSEFKGKMVESFVKSYTGAVSSIQCAVDASGKELSKYKLRGEMILPKLLETTKTEAYKEKSLTADNNITSMQYYSAAMLAMYILFVASMGTTYMIAEREEGTLNKLLSTKVSRRDIILGKSLGTFFIGVFDTVILILFTKYVFNVNWGNSLTGLIIISLCTIFSACGFAMFMAVILKTTKAVNSASSDIIMIMSFLGGSMYPLYQMPDAMQKMSKFMMNNWALRGYLGLMTKGGLNSIVEPSIILVIIGTVLLIAGAIKFKFD